MSLGALKREDKTLNLLAQIATIAPQSPTLTTLLVREINKVEDWVLSPQIIGLGTGSSSLSETEQNHLQQRDKQRKKERGGIAADVKDFLVKDGAEAAEEVSHGEPPPALDVWR